MTGAATVPTAERPQTVADAWQLVDALLFSVSHDLRSPLLGLTLSADLLREPAGSIDGATRAIALDGLRAGARDIERMLQTLTALSRARRRVFEHDRAPLGLILGGHIVFSEVEHLTSRVVAVDPMTVRELLDDVAGENPVEVQVSVQDGFVALSAPVNLDIPPFEGRPLEALASSLQTYAGGVVERLAAAQIVLDRQGASFAFEGGRLLVWLPAEASQ